MSLAINFNIYDKNVLINGMERNFPKLVKIIYKNQHIVLKKAMDKIP